ncbi:AfsR/SARP family transcriptional regulator [Sinanaerobacter chloroacetimidivorans]|uniref:Transcriptional regulator n=1 Tax=Sinanaerobacter chloroacetimidivorans TaxID=2818044 RepID=A0A8J7W4D7_9FIRM|nr:BTAD domain-containing putative transcriptional regulator [Sinanaerobacter chloroacetimidivorans]MBR0598861.1 transcriptional regulator [Sinanaerobacter chloroacetimidivorans]
MSNGKILQINNDFLEIQMLGDFSLQYGDKVLSGDKVRGKQVWNLLEYILVNRHKEVSMDRLIQTLWRDDEIEDPGNALKNLAYRLRGALKKSLDIKEGELIVYKHGAYAWNQELTCRVDVDILEDAYKATLQESCDSETLLANYARIVEIYKGNFLPQSSYKDWVVPLTVYYQRIYMESVERFSNLFLDRKDYKTAEEVCRKAIAVDPFVEINHANLIQALLGSNSHGKALEHYNSVCKLFYDELGVKPSDIITKLYQEIADHNTATEKDISLIKNDLKEIADITGAMYCNYEMFKTIYQMEARAALRSGKSIFIALLSVTGKGRKELSTKNIDEIFEKIKNAVILSLRKDDVVTRYGRTQFLLMLSNLTYENSNMVLSRLVKKINDSISDQIEVYGQMQTLDPIELEGIHAGA